LENYLFNHSMSNLKAAINWNQPTNWDLWEGKSTLSVEMLLKKLDKDVVWGESMI
jgi:hypothetical protein